MKINDQYRIVVDDLGYKIGYGNIEIRRVACENDKPIFLYKDDSIIKTYHSNEICSYSESKVRHIMGVIIEHKINELNEMKKALDGPLILLSEFFGPPVEQPSKKELTKYINELDSIVHKWTPPTDLDM